jgi:DNA polymerase-3 subunit gamma/tau
VLDAVVARDAAALAAEVERCFEQALAADDALAQLARALHRIALAQPVPASVDADDPDYAHITRLAVALTAEEAQLYYQIALHGRDDLRLAPDEQTALMMTFLRLLAFAPSNGNEPVRERAVVSSTSAATAAQTSANAPQASALPSWESAEGEGAGATRRPPVRPSAPSPSPQPSPARGEGAAPAMRQATASPQTPNTPDDQPAPREFDGDWLRLVAALPLAAMARELARHSVLISWDKNLLKLALPQDKRPLATQKERLAGTLSEYFGRTLKLEIELTDNAGESVAVRDKQVKDEKQAAAEAAFMADPAVQVLLTEGQGRIRAGSIQAND